MQPNSITPSHTTPKELAKNLGASPRKVCDLVRELGCYRKIGARVVMLEDDVHVLMENLRPCHSKSTNATGHGTSVGQLPEGDYAALQARRKKPLRKGSRRKKKPQSGDVILMAQARM